MRRTRLLVVTLILLGVALGFVLAVMLGSHMPPSFLGGGNYSVAVIMLAFAPVGIVWVGVGCVVAYRRFASRQYKHPIKPGRVTSQESRATKWHPEH